MIYKIACSWEVYGVLEIEAKTLEQAVEKAVENQEHCALPKESDYIDGSFVIDTDIDMARIINERKRR